MLGIEQPFFDDKAFPPNSFVQTGIVKLQDFVLEVPFGRTVFVEELHVGQQELGVVVILNVEVAPERHVAYHFGRLLLWMCRRILAGLLSVFLIAMLILLFYSVVRLLSVVSDFAGFK